MIQVLDPNLPQLQPRADKDGAVLLGRQSAQTQRVVNRFQLLELLEILEVVNEDLVLERYDDLVPPKLDAQNSAVEAELAYPFALVVVPNQHFFRGEGGELAAPDDREEVGAEEHRYQPNTSILAKRLPLALARPLL